jgi:YfiH family protein
MFTEKSGRIGRVGLRLKLNYPFSLDNQSGPAYLRVAVPDPLIAGFSLRSGGVSGSAFASANMSYSVGDDLGPVTANRQDLLQKVGGGRFATFMTCKQVHGNNCKIVTSRDIDAPEQLALFEADALLTDLPGVMLGIMTADCLPLIIVAKKAKAVAVVHAGWRGLEKGIAVAAVAELQRTFSVSVTDLSVYAGPAIAVCCFTVGFEVIERFSNLPELQGVNDWYKKLGSGFQLDLLAVQKAQLLAAGLAEYFSVGQYDLLKRFQAVCSKARADNINAGHACLC